MEGRTERREGKEKSGKNEREGKRRRINSPLIFLLVHPFCCDMMVESNLFW